MRAPECLKAPYSGALKLKEAASGDPSEARSIAGTRALKAPYDGALRSRRAARVESW